MAWKERESCLNIFRTKNHGQISDRFMKYESKTLVAQMSEADQFALYLRNRVVVMAWKERESCLIKFGTKNQDQISETFSKYESKVLLRKSVRVVFANPSGFDARIGIAMAWKERQSCLNIFWTRNRGCISETFTKYESKVLSRTQISDRFMKYKSKTLVAQMSETDQFALYLRNRVVVMAWKEREPCLIKFGTKNQDQISKTFSKYESKVLLRK
ncbi:uncharacterized protein G2W53_022220 [Senna tora]|uniref:Uncharacterized protein n=1 Tax=Senna tora TaxID=362788 RepID=A0A834WLV6_9FABA|nr:uncharacterized protein G2W53_022220 [Senna tora]